MRPLKILLDVDGVLAQTSEKVLRLYNKEHCQEVKIDDLIFWSYEDCPKITKDASKLFSEKGSFSVHTPDQTILQAGNSTIRTEFRFSAGVILNHHP